MRPVHPDDLDPAAPGPAPSPGGWRSVTPEEAEAMQAGWVRPGLDPAAVLAALPGTYQAVARALGATQGAALDALRALLRQGQVRLVRSRVGERVVGTWEVAT